MTDIYLDVHFSMDQDRKGPEVTHSTGDEKTWAFGRWEKIMFFCYLCGRSNLHERWNAMRIEVL